MTKRKKTIPMIGITGSAGKTTTSSFVNAVLQTRWRVLASRKNFNTPKHIKRRVRLLKKKTYDAVCFELSMAHGTREKHFLYFRPNISVITSVGTAHFGPQGNNIRSTANNKSKIIPYTSPDGMLLINADDRHSALLKTKTFKGKLITIGIRNRATYRATNVIYQKNGMSFSVMYKGKKETFHIAMLGEHNVIHALFAIAIADRLNFTAKQVRKGLRSAKKPPRRLQLSHLKKRSILLDDSFNANPDSVKVAVDILMKVEKNKKKYTILGDMLELGSYTKQGHRAIGKYLASKKLAGIYLQGASTSYIGQEAIKNGYPKEKVRHFNSKRELMRFLAANVDSNSVYLVKGSGGSKMSIISRHLRQLKR
ncbi:UDP-N-acetylmuramoyl-tripeptide--D-alanyl-D-alanine ligase [Alteribacter aurantiacus]|uniref:UDP-N-acetylmuramoyl-tripeptide--D-alanyl-D- alanine ligase n=1 Tax=Alteribacter aurantiacus TaxID=254410 RepID=UPI00040DEBC8|nr:UDP-N-acetylmuramoyl-tripeptide--D-alanyl-D-alanine ligase [Alteribacter aurantiacus]